MINSAREAADYYVSRLLVPVRERYVVHRGRHTCLLLEDGTADYVVFKRQPFLDYIRAEGGELYESLNTEVAAMVLRSKTPVRLVYVYPDGSVYRAYAKEIREYAGNVRLTNATAESTVTFPLKILERKL